MVTRDGISRHFVADCPTRQVLDRVGDRWSVLIIVLLKEGTRRFSELERSIEGISHKMLAQTLRSLERDGLVQRTVYPEVPARVEYCLTPLGETLYGPIGQILRWTEDHIDAVLAAQAGYDGRTTSPGSKEGGLKPHPR